MQQPQEEVIKAPVRISLDSTADGEKLSRVVMGEWYYRNKGIYVKYTEHDGDESIRTLVGWKNGQLKVTRRGSADSQQTFALGDRLPGYYANSQVRLNLDSETTLLRVVCDTVPGSTEDSLPRPTLPLVLEWHYKLWAADQEAGAFIVRLHAERCEDEDAATDSNG